VKNITSASRIKGGRYYLTVGKDFLNQFSTDFMKMNKKNFQTLRATNVDRTFRVSIGLVGYLRKFLTGSIFAFY
jgi:hypothetical protein